MAVMLIAGACVTYSLVGVIYARSQMPACYERAKYCPSWWQVRETVRRQVAWRVVAWPFAIPFDLIRGPLIRRCEQLGRWFWRPYDEHISRADRLRRDRDAWRQKLQTGTDVERQMAPDIIATLDALLRSGAQGG